MQYSSTALEKREYVPESKSQKLKFQDRTERQLTATQSELKLAKGFMVADQFLNQRYLDHFSAGSIEALPLMPNPASLRIYSITKIVYDADEQINDKLISVYSSLHSIDSAVAVVIKSSTKIVEFFIVTRSYENAPLAGETLCSSLKGNFPGIEISNFITGSEKDDLLKHCFYSQDNIKSLASVSLIPSERDNGKEKFVQGIEKFIGSMSGQEYSAILLAVPVQNDLLALRKRGFESLYSTLSPHAKISLSFANTLTSSVNEGISTSFADTISNSVGNSSGTSSSTSNGQNWGSNNSFNYQGFGFGDSSGGSSSYTTGTTFSETVSRSTSQAKTQGMNASTSKSTASTDTTTLNFVNKSVCELMERAKKELARIELSESYGLWDFCAYFYSDDVSRTARAASIFKSLVMGNESAVESAHINIWRNTTDIKKILDCVKFLIHPLAMIPAHDGFQAQQVTPTNMINGKELPLVLGFPRKSVSGFAVVEMAEFGRSVVFENNNPSRRVIDFGYIYHMGITEASRVPMDVDLFASHCFITGSSGSGKSYATYQLLDHLLNNDVNIMVVEPAKGEYKQIFGGLQGIRIFTTDPNVYKMLRINPFQFPDNLHVLTHVEKLMQIFTASWALYAAMPAILKEAVVNAYMRCGWDVMNSVYIEGISDHKFPVFQDVLSLLPELINLSDYSDEAKGNYKGALITRVKSMTTGITGLIFNSSEGIKDSFLFDSNVVIDLSDIGSEEAVALLMGVLIMRLGEYRQSVRKLSSDSKRDQKLRHVTVLEEAHNILKRTDKGHNQDGSNIVGQSVEMISNSIKEMRTYGEGFIIIDQSPMAVDASAIENTSTKIIMNTPAKDACNELSSALSLDEEQSKELSRLATGVAAVFQKGWLTPVLMKVDKWDNKYEASVRQVDMKEMRILRGKMIGEIIRQLDEEKFSAIDMRKIVSQSSIGIDKKKDFFDLTSKFYAPLSNIKDTMDVLKVGQLAIEILNCRGMLDVITINTPTTVQWDDMLEDIADESKRTRLYEQCAMWKQQYIQSIILYADIHDVSTIQKSMFCILCYLSNDGRNKNSKYYPLYDSLCKGII